MVSKDSIKEYLFDSIGFKSREEKVALGVASMEILYYFAKVHLEVGQSIILEELIANYQCKLITIRFYADIHKLIEQFIERDSSPERHRGHVINTQYPEVMETKSLESQTINPSLFLTTMEQRGILHFSIGGEEIIVDSTDFSKLSYDQILNKIKEKLSL